MRSDSSEGLGDALLAWALANRARAVMAWIPAATLLAIGIALKGYTRSLRLRGSRVLIEHRGGAWAGAPVLKEHPTSRPRSLLLPLSVPEPVHHLERVPIQDSPGREPDDHQQEQGNR